MNERERECARGFLIVLVNSQEMQFVNVERVFLIVLVTRVTQYSVWKDCGVNSQCVSYLTPLTHFYTVSVIHT